MLLRVRFRQGYTLADVCLVPVVIDAIDVHHRFIAIDLQAVPLVSLPLDELVQCVQCVIFLRTPMARLMYATTYMAM